MKNIHIKTLIGTILIGLFFSGCSNKILDETPRSKFTPAYFQTEEGVLGGITSLYANLRNIWGNGYWLNACETGTDEYTYAASADDNFKAMDCTGVSITPSNSRSDALWNNEFSDINTASGIIQYGSTAGISSSIIAEARFFRAFDYFNLVQTFGGVPLDLGSGELKFNTSASRSSVRDSVTSIYTRAIFPDLIIAADSLPATGRQTGCVTKTAARLYLAKAYLTYAWWLMNPNNIPTYPTVSTRTDPDGHNYAWYFQQAYNIAIEAINNPGPFSLQNSYYEVNAGANDRNSEMVLYADHTQDSEYYDDQSHSYLSGSSGNYAAWMVTWNYTNIRSSTTSNWSSQVSSVQREAVQSLGRPWTRMAPTVNAIESTFSDKVYDSRYDGTFATCLRGNWNKGGLSNTTLYNANALPVAQGDAILTFLNKDTTGINYSNSVYKSNVGAGILPGRADFVINPSGISRYAYPNLWKIGTYRTDNGTGLGEPNGGITRPFPIAKFSELYLIAAEAVVEGATPISGMGARDLVNVLRARAGVWTYSNSGNCNKTADYSAEMTAATPATITIDYILAERSREYFGEGLRWWDLVRTQKWADVAGSYSICGSAAGDHTLKTYARTISNYMYLRPIPQGQIDALQMTNAEKIAYQNPGY